MRGTCVALSLACLALAGCSGAGPGDEALPSTGAASGESGPAQTALPQWALRDWWTFETSLGAATYVVTGEGGADWTMDTTDEATAFRDARFDVSRLGPQRKSDLAGSQGGGFVQYFQWPLRDNATWQTTWDGVPVTVTAHAAGEGRFDLVARNATADMYRYTYDPAVAWFRDFSFLGMDGEPQFTMRLTGSGHNFTGEVVRWHLETVYEGPSTDQGLLAASVFEVPAGATDLWVSYDLECPNGSGGYLFGLRAVNPPGQDFTANGQCTSNHFADVAVAAPAAGTWSYQVNAGGGPGTTVGALMLLRTLESIPVPAA